MATRRQSNVRVVCKASFLTQSTPLWKVWCTQGRPVMCKLKPRHNLRDLMRPAIPSSCCSARLNYVSLPLLQSFFLIRWDFIRPPLSATAIGCEISEGKACGNHSISCAHLAQHLYRRAGGFWKSEKSFTKRISAAGLTQTDTGNSSHNSQLLLTASSLLVVFVRLYWLTWFSRTAFFHLRYIAKMGSIPSQKDAEICYFQTGLL